ncbi:LysR substrate-binding domain-containing protein [Pseudomonas aeruginosa]|nr:LysR substrate-binding domain-containing protein [Pseudomonas aeruginosa]
MPVAPARRLGRLRGGVARRRRGGVAPPGHRQRSRVPAPGAWPRTTGGGLRAGRRRPAAVQPRPPADRSAIVPRLLRGMPPGLGPEPLLRDSGLFLQRHHSSSQTEGLRFFAQSRLGVAWLPHTLVREDLASRRLVRAGGQRSTCRCATP